MSRRAMLRRSATLGAVAVGAAPLVETVLIPTAAAHASTAPPPPPQPVRIAEINHDEMSAVVNIPPGMALPGRFLVRRGDTKVFAPTPPTVFGIKVGPFSFKFINDLTTPGAAPYHYILRGKDGLGHIVNVIIPGTPGATIEIPLGPQLDLAVYWVQDIAATG